MQRISMWLWAVYRGVPPNERRNWGPGAEDDVPVEEEKPSRCTPKAVPRMCTPEVVLASIEAPKFMIFEYKTTIFDDPSC